MSMPNNPAQHLVNLLQEEIRHAGSLLDFLKQERATLAAESVFADSHSDEKIRRIEALQDATRTRTAFAENNGLPGGPSATGASPQVADSAELQVLYSQLTGLARQCAEENRQVGQLINRRAQFITGMLDSLSPGSRNPQAVIYEENGNTSNDPHNRLMNPARI